GLQINFCQRPTPGGGSSCRPRPRPVRSRIVGREFCALCIPQEILVAIAISQRAGREHATEVSARYGQHRPIELVVEPDANDVGREPDILSKNRGGRPWEPGNGVVIAAAQRPLPTDSSAIVRRAAVLGCATGCAGLFLPTIKVGSLSLFRIFYALVPGAAAIRAGCRAMIVSNLFA